MEKEVRRVLVSMSHLYTAGRKLGSGSYGVVYEVFSVPDGTPFAAKFITASTLGDSFLSDDAIRELRATAKHAPSEHLIAFSQVLIFSNFTTCFIMKRYDCTLAALLKVTKLAHASVVSVFSQLVAALGALHAAGTCHRDVKAENILVDFASGSVVLADLGVAKNDVHAYHAGGCLTGEVATCGYAPIETLLPLGRYGTAMDVWALGVLVYEMLVGRKPFPVCNDRAAHARVIIGTHGVPEACSRCVDGGCLETECALNFLRHTCCQVMGAVPVASRLPNMLAAQPEVDAKLTALVLDMLQYVPELRPSVAEIAASAPLAGFVDCSDTRTLSIERKPPLPFGGALVPVLPLHTTRTLITVLWAFEPLEATAPQPAFKKDATEASKGEGEAEAAGFMLAAKDTVEDAAFTAVNRISSPPPRRNKWDEDGPDFKPRLLYLLDFYLHEHADSWWSVEAWLLGMEACRLTREYKATPSTRPDTIERIAAYLQYGLALASPTQSDPPYCRYDWISRIPVRVLDVYCVSTEEVRLIAELRGRAPRVSPSEWKCAPAARREFFECTVCL